MIDGNVNLKMDRRKFLQNFSQSVVVIQFVNRNVIGEILCQMFI